MGGRGSSFSGSGPLGQRGKPKTISEALKNTTPNYLKGRKWQQNCQRCVYAYEMNRRGYDVEAMPYILNGRDGVAQNWRNIMKKQTWEKMPSHETAEKLRETMRNFGDGAKAVVYVVWKRDKTAHAFIAEQVGSKTKFVDPQTGQHVNIASYLKRAIKGNTEISRIDNLEPSKYINGAVKRRKS